MPQEATYPDPEQLRAWADEPMPFHSLRPGQFVVTPDGELLATAENVEYRYRPAHINVETGDGYERIDHLADTTLVPSEAWDDADDVQVEEDFVCATGMISEVYAPGPGPSQYDAHWLLSSVRVNANPRPPE